MRLREKGAQHFPRGQTADDPDELYGRPHRDNASRESVAVSVREEQRWFRDVEGEGERASAVFGGTAKASCDFVSDSFLKGFIDRFLRMFEIIMYQMYVICKFCYINEFLCRIVFYCVDKHTKKS